jgi:hypothetical protein
VQVFENEHERTCGRDCLEQVPQIRSQTSAFSSPGPSSPAILARASSGESSAEIDAAPRTISVIGQNVIPSP